MTPDLHGWTAPAIAIALWATAGSILWIAGHARIAWIVRRFRELRACAAPDPPAWPRLSVVLAARDEGEHLEAAARTLLSQDYPDLEIVLVDDRSTDGTPAIVRRLAADDPRVVAVRVDALPPGWLGKVHALHVGTGRATGAFTLYTDADVHFAPGVLRRAVAHAIDAGLDHLAVGPEVRAGSLLHRAATAAFLGTFSLGVRAHRIEDPKADAYAGVGAFNLVRREAFDRTPGFPWLRMEVLDDVGLGLLMHRAGARGSLLFGRGLLAIDWYPSFTAMARGLEKNLFAAVGRYSATRLTAIALLGLAFLAAPLLALSVPVPAVRALGVLALAANVVSASVARTRSHLPFAALLLAPVGQLCLLLFATRSAWACLSRGGVVWRDTFYPLDALRKGQRVRL